MIIIFIIFFAENELTELVTGEDLEIILEEQKYLKLEIYLAIGE